MKYDKEHTSQIVFPLGGIGSGCIGLCGNGTLRDFEIFNRPNKNSYNKYASILVKAEDSEKVLDVRALNGICQGSFMGDDVRIGHGIERNRLPGLPWFEDFSFDGEFPIASIDFSDAHFPAVVQMRAWNPFIPSNDKDSSLPAAIFEIDFLNYSDKELVYTAAINLTNPCEESAKNSVVFENGMTGILFENTKYEQNEPEYGQLYMGTDCLQASYQQYWKRNSWYEGLEAFWQDFSRFGQLQNRVFDGYLDGESTASLTATVKVRSQEHKKIRFVISWYYPNCYNYWNPEKGKRTIWKNYYATLYADAISVAKYIFDEYSRLYGDTEKFTKALYSSSLPNAVMDAVGANLSVLKSPTCMRLEDGTFYGFEGCSNEEGSCEGTCGHVWLYQYALPFLFSSLQRSIRDTDCKYNEDRNGGMKFRLQLPLGREQWDFRPAADGHLGGIIQTYREWKICGDMQWLKKHWPILKRNMEYVWSEKNPDCWDREKNGVLMGRQHHTLDRELFGPNAWLSGYYLCALKAMAEMAEYLGEDSTEYLQIFEKGKCWIEENLFNGCYFVQKTDIKDLSILDKYENSERYRDEENGEIKFQIGEGCIIDQVIGQWHANILGLGEIYSPDKVKSALKSIYRYNYKESMKECFNPCRVFALEEPGVIICEWPDGTQKPKVPITYSAEVMTGFEYQAAVHMISEGMFEEGEKIISSIRNRYDGKKRNPWNEFECGSHYARSMASYSALLVYSGFRFDMSKYEMGFQPLVQGDCSFFWSLDHVWGCYKRKGKIQTIEVLYGVLKIQGLILDGEPESAKVDGEDVEMHWENGRLVFPEVKICRKSIKIQLKK